MPLSKKDKVPKIILEEKKLTANRGSVKHIVNIMILTLVFTTSIAAIFHLSVVGLFAVIRTDASLINPIEFLGLNTIAPGLSSSLTASLLGWLALVILYWIVYRILTSFDTIAAVWYTSEAYTKLGTGLSILKRLSTALKDDYQIKQYKSFYYLIKKPKK